MMAPDKTSIDTTSERSGSELRPSVQSRPTAFLLLVYLLVSVLPVRAAEDSVPVEVTDYREIYVHLIRPEPVVTTPWTDISKGVGAMEWNFALTVDEYGTVVAAALRSGPGEFRQEATRAAMSTRFRAFERNGRATSVRLAHAVRSQTLDYSGPHDREFPQNQAPDVNAADAQGFTAIEQVNYEDAASALIEAGARLPTDPSRLSTLMQKATNRKWTTLLARLTDAAAK